MKYEITITPSNKNKDDINEVVLTLDTEGEGTVKVKSYGTIMDFQSFGEFAGAVQEMYKKFAALNNNTKNDDGQD
jgi:hypothetical protein